MTFVFYFWPPSSIRVWDSNTELQVPNLEFQTLLFYSRFHSYNPRFDSWFSTFSLEDARKVSWEFPRHSYLILHCPELYSPIPGVTNPLMNGVLWQWQNQVNDRLAYGKIKLMSLPIVPHPTPTCHLIFVALLHVPSALMNTYCIHPTYLGQVVLRNIF